MIIIIIIIIVFIIIIISDNGDPDNNIDKHDNSDNFKWIILISFFTW